MHMVVKRTAHLTLCLALAVVAGCSAAPQQGSLEQAESSASSATAPESASSPGLSSAESDVPEDGTAPTPGAISLEANGSELSMALADTDAARALAGKLADGPITLELSAYGGFEKVGQLGFSLPASDEQVTAQPGDVMLYQGDQITVFTGSNTWAYTRLGRIESANPGELAAILGEDDVSATLSLG